MDYNKYSKLELLKKCDELGIKKCKSKTKSVLIELINTKINENELTNSILNIDEELIISNTNLSNIDLFLDNIEIIKVMCNNDDTVINYINTNYNRSSNHNDNVYNFIYSYINGIKLIHQDYINCNYTLIDKIKSDKNIKILWGNCLDKLKQLPNESIGLICTSPPYYNAREYSTWTNLNEYLLFMTEVIKECYRVLDNHRVFVFNISDVVDNDNLSDIRCWGERKIPLPSYFIKIFEECGFTYVDDIIWDKGEVQSSRHKNKNTPYPFYQYPINCYEHILIFHKHRLEKDIKYPCSVCGSLNVKTNSYTYRGLRSWECCNPNCNRSDSNRGKRFSLKTIITQDTNKQQRNIIDNEFIDNWRRDIHKLTPVIKINNKKKII